MAEIVFAGDTHGALDHFGCVPDNASVIHVGDFAPLGDTLEQALPQHLHERFWWVPGNHDFDKPEHFRNVFTPFGLARCFHLKVVQIGTVRIAGMGCIFSHKTWWPKHQLTQGKTTRELALKSTPRQDKFEQGLSLRQRKYLFREDFDALAGQTADVLVTHEAPVTHEYGFFAIGELARLMGAHTIVHGHQHLDYQAELDGIRVVGVGLRGLKDFDGQVIKPGE